VAVTTIDWSALRGTAPPTRSDVESPAHRLVEQAIDPGDHVCGPTALDAYFEELLG